MIFNIPGEKVFFSLNKGDAKYQEDHIAIFFQQVTKCFYYNIRIFEV